MFMLNRLMTRFVKRLLCFMDVVGYFCEFTHYGDDNDHLRFFGRFQVFDQLRKCVYPISNQSGHEQSAF